MLLLEMLLLLGIFEGGSCIHMVFIIVSSDVGVGVIVLIRVGIDVVSMCGNI